MRTTDAYIAALDDALVGSARVRRGLVQEARDHLEDASDALRRSGYPREAAERRAVQDFGSLGEVVPAFQTTLAVASSRRTAWLLLAALAIQPFLWDGPLGPNAPDPDGSVYAVLDVAVEYGGGLMILTSIALIVATGIGNRWFSAGRRVARLTAVATITAAVLMKLSAISMLLLSGDGAWPWVLFLLFIVGPMSLAAASARRTLATC